MNSAADLSGTFIVLDVTALAFAQNSNGFESRNFYCTTVWKLFPKIFIRSGKMCHLESNSITSKSSQ